MSDGLLDTHLCVLIDCQLYTGLDVSFLVTLTQQLEHRQLVERTIATCYRPVKLDRR